MQLNPDWNAVQTTVRQGTFCQPLVGGPVTLLLGTNIQAYDADAGTMTVGFSLDGKFLNDNGVVMGGIVSSALDLAMAMVVMARADENTAVATTNLQVQFFRPCLPGPHSAQARIVKLGRRTVFCEAQLYDGAQKHVATATSTNQLLEPA